MDCFFAMIASMSLNFIFANLDRIALVVWLVFFVIVLTSHRNCLWGNKVCSNIALLSYGWLVSLAVAIHFLYGIFATWGQYVTWAKGDDVTHALLSAPLAPEVPFPSLFEWARPFFMGNHGYFAFYSFQHFFLSTIALLVVAGLFFAFLVIRARYYPINFREGDIAMIVLALLIAGWPGAVVLLPIGLLVAVIFSLGARFFYGIERVPLPPAFLAAAPVALLFAIPILTFFHLYPLLKL